MSDVFASRTSSTGQSVHTKKLRVVIAGPDLIAQGLANLLSVQARMEVLPSLPDIRQVVAFTLNMRELHTPVDVVVLDWNGNAAYQDVRLQTLSQLSQHRQTCLVMLTTISPEEVEDIKQAGARGYIFATSSCSQFAGAIQLLAANKEAIYFPALPERAFACHEEANLEASRQLVFRQERLDAYARTIGWQLKEKEIYLFRHFTCGIPGLAQGMNRQSELVRHDLSQHVYQFLTLLAGRTVNRQFLAFQALLEYGILEYVPRSPAI